MEKFVTFAQNEGSEAWSPLSTGVLGGSMGAKDSTGFSPINDSSNSHNDENVRPSTPTRTNQFSSTPFILSTSTSSPNLLLEKPNLSVFAKYRDSPKSKMFLANTAKLQDHVKVLQSQLSTSEHRQEALEAENADLQKQVKMLQDHIIRQEANFNQRIEEAVRIEDENTSLAKVVEELKNRLTSVLAKLGEAESEAARMNSDLDEKVSQLSAVQSELKICQAKNIELSDFLKQMSADDEKLSAENVTLQQNVRALELELSQMRTKLQDKHDLLIAVERQRDVLEEKLRQNERKLEELQDNTMGDNMSSGLGAAASSQMQLHIMSQIDNLVSENLKNQMEDILNKKLSEMAQIMSAQSQPSIANSFAPSAPASISGNDYDDINSIKAESLSRIGSNSCQNDLIDQFSAAALGDTTITSNCDPNSAGLGNIGSISNPSTSTWKKPGPASSNILTGTMGPPPPMQINSSMSVRTKVLDWLPSEPEGEEMFEEEARFHDREFVKRTALGAASRKRLIQQEESRCSFPEKDSEDPNSRLSELAERNRKQPIHMRSAYAIEESAFLVSENDLRTGKTLSIEGLASSTPMHTETQSQLHRMTQQQLRKPNVPVTNRPTSMYASAPPKTTSSSTPTANIPSSIPKPTTMIISPPNRSRIPTPKPESIVNSSISISSNDSKENAKTSSVLVFSPPARAVRGKISKPSEVANNPTSKNGEVFVVSPPQRTAANKAATHRPTEKTKATSTPKKFLQAVGRAFGSSSSKNTSSDQ